VSLMGSAGGLGMGGGLAGGRPARHYPKKWPCLLIAQPSLLLEIALQPNVHSQFCRFVRRFEETLGPHGLHSPGFADNNIILGPIVTIDAERN
jgi:hypothetical protein